MVRKGNPERTTVKDLDHIKKREYESVCSSSTNVSGIGFRRHNPTKEGSDENETCVIAI